MLNRRVLRIKGMQTLFAYYQAKEANYLLAQDFISEKLQPNLNLDVPENKVEMAEKEKEALKLLLDWKKSNDNEIESIDSRVVETVTRSTEYFEELLEKDFKSLGKRMLVEIDNLYSLYFLCLELLLEFGKLNEKNNLGSNSVLDNLKENSSLQAEIMKRNLSWKSEERLLKKINNALSLEDQEIKDYLLLDTCKVEDDRKILNHILKVVVFGNDDLTDYFENRDLYWVENKNILKSMLKKTVKDSSKTEVLKISHNWDEDSAFFKDLFVKTIENESYIDGFISKQAKNWDKDRFALTDLIILKMGIAEMISFSNVPVKVTINEYIEISKSYSTPKSKEFINGMLDKASNVLQNEGKIKKSGRGLIDNK